jgi:hypothetical protein
MKQWKLHTVATTDDVSIKDICAGQLDPKTKWTEFNTERATVAQDNGTIN